MEPLSAQDREEKHRQGELKRCNLQGLRFSCILWPSFRVSGHEKLETQCVLREKLKAEGD